MNKDFYTLKDSSIAYFFSLVAILGASIFISLLISVVSSLQGVPITQVQEYPIMQYINMFMSSFVFFIVFIGINKKFKKNTLQASKLKTKLNYWLILVSILLGIVVFLGCLNITELYNFLFAHIFPEQSSNVIETNNFGIFLIQVLILGVMPAVFEELVFRGIIYNGLRQKFSCVIAIVLSALFFMLMHLSIYKTFYQFILGIVLGILVYYTGSIIYGMIFHFTNNFIIILSNYISPNGSIFELVPKGEILGSNWGATQIILAIVFFIISVGLTILIFYLIRKYTLKHKKYYNLENSSAPLNFETMEEINLSNNSKLSGGKSGAVVWYSFAIIGFALLWLFVSCGVNL